KCDVAPEEAGHLAKTHEGSVAFSALTGEGVEALLLTIGDRLRTLTDTIELFVPCDRGDVLASVHREGEVLSETVVDGGMQVMARLDETSARRLQEFVVAPVAGRAGVRV